MSMINKRITILIVIISALALFYCAKKVVTDRTTGQWLVNRDELFRRGTGKGGIPVISVPIFDNAYRAVYLDDNDLVAGIKINGEYRAYAYRIMSWHEIANDISGDDYFSVIYCPFTGVGAVWKREYESDSTSFGVSDLVHNSSHLVFDHASDSYWLPIKSQCVYGVQIGQRPERLNFVETSWATWQEMYPNTVALSNRNGYVIDYTDDPYPQYSVDDDLLYYPINNYDGRLPNKERVFTVITGYSAIVYRVSQFPDTVMVRENDLEGTPIVVAVARSKRLAVSFVRVLDDNTTLTFQPIQDSLPAILIDNEGTTWDVFGEAISGPRTGQHLQVPVTYNAYWFAVAAIYPDVEVIEP